MRTLFVGDVHGCADEFASILEAASADRVILLGDLFTKGPDPVGVWRLVQQHSCEAVLGNHDHYLLRKPGSLERLGLPQAVRPWLSSLPLWIEGEGWLAIHAGVHPTGGLEETDVWIATMVRAWPSQLDPHGPGWYEAYAGDQLVIYGHDARRGLVDHRPRTLGLDTGCVYGGQLSAYLLEEDRVLQVVASRPYRPVDPSISPGPD